MINIFDVIELGLVQQITLYICIGIIDLLGDENRDSGTIRSDCSDATMATSKTASFVIINYLEPPLTPPLENPAPLTSLKSNTTSKEDETDSSLTPITTPSTEVALYNRSAESKED